MESSPSDMQLFGDDVLEHQYLDTSSSKPPKLDPISIEPSEPTGLSKTEQVFGASLELSGFGVSTGAQEDLVGKGEVSSQSPHDVVSFESAELKPESAVKLLAADKGHDSSVLEALQPDAAAALDQSFLPYLCSEEDNLRLHPQVQLSLTDLPNKPSSPNSDPNLPAFDEVTLAPSSTYTTPSYVLPDPTIVAALPASTDRDRDADIELPHVLPAERKADVAPVIGTSRFEYDAELLDEHLEDILKFWRGQREPVGVDIEDANRCQ